ncbi:MAG TPA: sugar phosphate isomerase/epimerase [Candidatus Cybelea sp.]|nr:sugar phosphate isomerase/epimerase [Candidatus Cybelea sp.]
MPRLGIHTFVWTPAWDRKGAELCIKNAAAAKLNTVEIALLDPDIVDVEHTRKTAEKAKIGLTCSLGLPAKATLPDFPDEAEAFLRRALDVTKAVGASCLTGVTYATLGRLVGAPPKKEHYDILAKTLKKVARYARSLGLEFGLEACNRYETFLLNTGAQTISLIERIGEPNVFLHLDTYHMNIEEKSFEKAIVSAGKHLKYIHLSESDRGTPGTGTVDWDGIFKGLRRAKFDGEMVMESFVNLPPDIARALAVWKPVAAGGAKEVVGKGIPFLRRKMKQHGVNAG